MNRQSVIFALATGIIVATVVGCAHVTPPPSLQSNPVILPGTGDSQDILRELAQDYMAHYPDRQVVVPDSIDSHGAIRVVGTGEAPIGRVARQPNTQELANYGAFRYIEFARVPVAFVVNPQAGVHNLSERHICDIFSGRIRNWEDVGGNNLPIEVQTRPDDGSNMKAIRQHMACFAELQVTPQAHFNLRNATLVDSMQTSVGAIGFMPLSEAERYGYHTVRLDGVAPDMPHYKLGIGLGFVYKNPLSAGIQAFLDYLKTAPAQNILRQTGHVPVAG